MCEHGDIGQDPYYDRFDSWTDAVEQAGFNSNNQGSAFSEKELIDELQRLANELGHTPTKEEMCKHGDIGQDPYYDRFDNWNFALQEAGFEPNQRSKIQRGDLIAELHRLAGEYNQTPTRNLLRKNGEYHDDAYVTEFGTWNDALRKAGFDPNHEKNVGKAELLQHIRDLADELGHPPSISDLQERDKYSSTPYYDQLGGWTNTVREAGFEPDESGGSEPIPREELTAHLQRLDETLGREPTKHDLLDCPDTPSATPFYREFDSFTEAKQVAGVKAQSDTTNIERTLYEILDNIGVEYETEVNLVGNFLVDVIMPEQRVVIEADGNYWHGHPHMQPYDEKQEEKIESDTRKDRNLLQEGYHVIRFWGDTITNQKARIKEKVRKIAESGELPDHGKHVFGPEPEPKSTIEFDSEKERVNHSLSEFTT